MSEAKQVVVEIQNIVIQYQAEVGKGRKAWPKSIRERVEKLFSIGLNGKESSRATKIPYYTVFTAVR
ncbi:MAG: hypothetical protein ACXWRU_16555 [Pseudobdellovibrionaceae bacterium]